MSSRTTPQDSVQAGYRAGLRAAAEDGLAGSAVAERPALLARAALACARQAAVLPALPLHDPLIARERFVWSFVLGYEERAAAARPPRTAGRTAALVRRGR